jgi:DNA invertase Pin-like site-specific DNA recombinase
MMEQKVARCAIYTRKSCEEGLDQEFNSLDAQRLSGENYIASQMHENWRLISKHYDDGGFSGGNMDRPALQELFKDIESGQIDMVVVYKIDRLSRSLFDFSKIIELFEKHSVGFVSVTQAFNTSTSSGKLMLNMLLSFAQYERELTGERIRDKVAASKKKGLWMGGYPMLGYDCKDRKLVINESEAKIVRFIYEQFQLTESCSFVSNALNRSGHRTKSRSHCNGKVCGGRLYAPLQVRRILTSPYYKGSVTHKGSVYEGEHEAIIDEETWNHVQTLFKKQDETTANGQRRKGYATATSSFLKGILKCARCNVAMTPTYAYNHGLRYRYYACSNHIRCKSCTSDFKTVPAEDVEQKVIEEVLEILRSPEIVINVEKIAERETHGRDTKHSGNAVREGKHNNIAATSPEISKQNLVVALKNLTEVWSFLYPTEQQKVVSMLMDEVTIGDDGIRMKMDLKGFDHVMRELSV